METFNLEQLRAEAEAIFYSVEWWYWAAGGGVLLLLILFLAFRNSGKKRKARQVAPRIKIHAFQLSPLGRDAYLKLRNDGDVATISNLQIKGRNDIAVKNAFAGHQLEREKIYGLLLEATGKRKIKKDFVVEVTFLDQLGNVYRQHFAIGNQTAKQARLVRYA